VTDIFSSLQGEGLFVGEPMVFVRLAGCPWRCRYCDTPGSLSLDAGSERTVEDVLARAQELERERPHKAVSLTGGEPLLQADFSAALLKGLKGLGVRTYLETSGTHPEALRGLIADTDVVAMDVKLPSAIGRVFWAEHEEFLRIAGGKAFVKIVLTEDTNEEEMARAIDLLSAARPVPPLVLQPATVVADIPRAEKRGQHTHLPVGEMSMLSRAPGASPPSPKRTEAWKEFAQRRLTDVRVLPQMHPLWGVQ
jgi:organic radical activating enzyme